VSLHVSLIYQSILLCGESEGRVSVLKDLVFFGYCLLLCLQFLIEDLEVQYLVFEFQLVFLKLALGRGFPSDFIGEGIVGTCEACAL